MPVTKSLPYTWYDTPNIHLCTIRDFLALCAEMDVVVERAVALDHRGRPLLLKPTGRLANLLAAQVLFEVRKR